MTELSDYIHCVSDPHAAALEARISALSAALTLSEEARVRAERERDEVRTALLRVDPDWFRRDETTCAYPDCGCDFDAICHVAIDAAHAQASEALVRELVEGLRPFATGFLNRDVWTDDVILEVGCFNAQSNAKFAYPGLRVGDFRKAHALILRAEGEGSSVADIAAPVASQPGCSAAQSLDGKGEL